MTLKPSSLGNTTQNYLGRSQFSDPYFNGLLDEFQIRNRVLTATEVAALAALAAPPNAPTGLAATAGDQSAALAWNTVAGATDNTVKRGTVCGCPYATVVRGLPTAGFSDTGLTAGTTYYYIVIAQKLVTDSALSAQANATALVASMTVNETGSGATRTLEVQDLYLTADPTHPKRFFRLWIESS